VTTLRNETQHCEHYSALCGSCSGLHYIITEINSHLLDISLAITTYRGKEENDTYFLAKASVFYSDTRMY
jgi:hypothetical protein